MRKFIVLLGLISGLCSNAQDKLEDLLAAGIEDAQRFASGYIKPGTEGLMHNISNGWIRSAEVKKQWSFDISLVANASFVKERHRSFSLITAEYNNLKFRDGSLVQNVATALGENKSDIRVYSVVTDGENSQEVEFELPQGLASVNMDILPTAFLQGSIGVFKGTEVKMRFFPKIKQEDIKVGFFGFGVQHEFTSWLPAENTFPLAISGLVAYTNLGASYDFTNFEIVTGSNQRFDLNVNSWLFQAQVSTKWPMFNFYGGIGYVSGKSDFHVLGTYKVIDGIPITESTNEFKDPFTIKNKVSDVRGTIGAELSLGFFGLNLDYNFAEFDNASLGLHFGI